MSEQIRDERRLDKPVEDTQTSKLVAYANRQRRIGRRGAAGILAAGALAAGASLAEGHTTAAVEDAASTGALATIVANISDNKARRAMDAARESGQPLQLTARELEKFKSPSEHNLG